MKQRLLLVSVLSG